MSEGTRAEPSPDLFARVVASIDDDRARRRHLARVGALWLAGTTAVTAGVLALTPRDGKGLHMPWWILEVGTNLALLAIALWLGPFIKRFGRAYAADVFHDNPLTGKSYIVLTDIVYYLIFAAYILFSVHVSPQTRVEERDLGQGQRGAGDLRARPARRHTPDHRDPARPQHRPDAAARADLLAQPAAAEPPAVDDSVTT